MKAAVPTLTFSFAIVVPLSGFGCLHPLRDQPSLVGKQDRSGVILRGTVIRKEWTKIYESWNADGSEYYVLNVEDVLVRPWLREGVLLRASKSVPFSEFARHRNQQVTVEGSFVEARPFKPLSESGEQYPLDPLTGNAEHRGGGFEVHSIKSATRPW